MPYFQQVTNAKQKKDKKNSINCCWNEKRLYVCQTKTHIKNQIIMKAIRLTTEQVKNDSIREYNPTEWNKIVDRKLKFSNVEFFKVEKGNGYDYDRYFVKYTTPEGLALFNSLSYSSTLSNGGFSEVFINEFSFENNVVEFYPENEVEIKIMPMKRKIEETGEIVDAFLNNSIEARNYMIKCSQRIGSVWSKL